MNSNEYGNVDRNGDTESMMPVTGAVPPPINPVTRICPRIYAWSTDDVPKYAGWLKIGYTDHQTVEGRVAQQASQLKIDKRIEWEHTARKNEQDASGRDVWFTDHEFHRFLIKHGVKREPGSEWFDFSSEPNPAAAAERLFQQFITSDWTPIGDNGSIEYTLRAEQELAVEKTLAYFRDHDGGEFLWNAKPRFGKTLSAYDLMRRSPKHGSVPMTLIVTNRPAIASSWHDDYEKFIAGAEPDLRFVSTADTLSDASNVMTREQFRDEQRNHPSLGMVAFLSMQDLKGSRYFGGDYEKLDWVRGLEWDMLIIDESHEGVDTMKSDMALGQIKRHATLYLSGTPFKALHNNKFKDEQIYTWSYMDEQQAKLDWPDDGKANPYADMPQMTMYTYQMSQAILDKARMGMSLGDGDERNLDYAFDLNEFFSTDPRGRFNHHDDVVRFLDNLTSGEGYPFSTPELRDRLKHTFWLVGNRVDSAKAMSRLLKDHPVFGDYEIVLAAGDGLDDADDSERAEEFEKNTLKRVRDAIKDHDKTITLSVGQLTTGVTVPEWSAVLMLSNTASPAQYVQASFRAQNPWCYTDENGDRHRKDTAYVFDFAPERSLQAYDAFANDLVGGSTGCGDDGDREGHIRRLLNFLPVIGEDESGVMRELDPASILSIPHNNLAREVVRQGFMSNLLFDNIANIFNAPSEIRDILNTLAMPTAAPRKQVNPEDNVNTDAVDVDEDGEVVINEQDVDDVRDSVFGEKVYADIPVDPRTLAEELVASSSMDEIDDMSTKAAQALVNKIIRPEMRNVVTETGGKLSPHQRDSILDGVTNETADAIRGDAGRLSLALKNKARERGSEINAMPYGEDRSIAADNATREISDLTSTHVDELEKTINDALEAAKRRAIEEAQRSKANDEKNTEENKARERLRGLTRTIPSFIMAYGDESLTLANFDQKVDDAVFTEVTGITLDQFRKLRDGWEYTDEKTGETVRYPGCFNEVVFNQSVAFFLKKKSELSDWFDPSITENIFDYIPSQRTNQIFTPPRVVEGMVDMLEEQTPGIFTDPSRTFADLYSKSGLYCAEVIKRLYAGLASVYPDEHERLKHIMEEQVYGIAPTEIIHRIMLSFLFGSPKTEGLSQAHFITLDTAVSAKQGSMYDDIAEAFGIDIDDEDTIDDTEDTGADTEDTDADTDGTGVDNDDDDDTIDDTDDIDGDTEPTEPPVSIKDLIDQGVLPAGQVLFLDRGDDGDGDNVIGVTTNDGKIIVNGNIYATPSEAASAILGSEPEGWSAWRAGDPSGPTLSDLRGEYLAREDNEAGKHRRKKKYYGVTVKDIVSNGILTIGQKLVLDHGDGNEDVIGTVDADGNIIVNGNIYKNPSGAAEGAMNQHCNGWLCWHVDNLSGPTLSDLRDRLIEL